MCDDLVICIMSVMIVCGYVSFTKILSKSKKNVELQVLLFGNWQMMMQFSSVSSGVTGPGKNVNNYSCRRPVIRAVNGLRS